MIRSDWNEFVVPARNNVYVLPRNNVYFPPKNNVYVPPSNNMKIYMYVYEISMMILDNFSTFRY